MTRTLLAVPGSLRADSFNAAIARAAGAFAPAGTTCEFADLVRGVPLYDQDLDADPPPAPVAEVRRRIGAAHGVLFVTPEYNYGIPGGLKNLVDWASRPFGKHCLVGRPVAVIGAGPGSRGGRAAVEYLRMVLPALGAVLVGDEVMVPKVNEHLDPGDLRPSDELAAHVEAALAALAAATPAPAS